MFERELHQRVTAVQVQLLTDVGAVVFDRTVMDAQFVGDLFAGLVIGN
jgi:hypothetical protein